ncbi:MAG TPA: dodecin family protein [Nitrososphaera sp.]|jgi:flavin-binding protein dodecin|nr:dodecin family protein [uncultured Nitrososphaera sp.]HEU4984350.1 dodecin family protein [Nitrososphaera sp.]
MVFKYIDILGESTKSFEDAVQNAITETARTVKDIRTAEVMKMNAIVNSDKIVEYQAVVRVAFKVRRKEE